MDSQLYFILDNNMLTPIDQENICYIISSGSLVPISNDNNIINPEEFCLVASEELVYNNDQQIMPLHEGEPSTSGLQIPIDESRTETLLDYKPVEMYESAIDGTTNWDIKQEKILNSYKCEHCTAQFVHLKLLNRHKRTHLYEKPFKCEQCHESFNFAVNLKVHSTNHQDTLNGTTKNMCCICNRIFRRFSSLRGHINRHKVSEYFNCEQCDEIFLAKLFYDLHLENHHKKDKKDNKITQIPNGGSGTIIDRDCKLCGKSFKKPSMLIRHMRVHNGEKPFKCNMCEKQFSQKNSLNTHLLRHTGNKPFTCNLCYMRFTQNGNLKIHKQKVHNKYSLNADELKYSCNKCSCVFRKIGSLNRHITEVHSINERKRKLITTAPPPSNDEINFNEIFSQLNDLNKFQAPPVTVTNSPNDNDIIQLADRVENGILIHRKVQQLHTDRGKKMLSCLNCGKLFTRPSDLLRHIRVHTKEKPFECYLCKRRFSVKRTLSVHYKTHESTLRKFSCSLCNKNFRDIGTLIVHGTELHQNCSTYLQCFPCKAHFSNADQLQTHSKEHNHRLSVTKRKCYDTDVKMQDPIIVNQIKKNEDTRKRSYKCEKCFKSFIKLCHLKQHQLSHTGDRPFSCDKCIKTFKSRNALTIHTRRHLNQKPYKCDTCDEYFVSKPILNRHKLTHSEVRNFICPYCQKSFKSNPDCRKHIRIHQKEILTPEPPVDSNPKPIDQPDIRQPNLRTCQYCNRYFKKPIDLRRHERIHTGERPFKCDKCEKSFSLASTLKFHHRIHEEIKQMFTCHVCLHKFTTKGSLNVHKRIHTGEKPFKCRYCGTAFRTNDHRKVHESNHLKIAFERGVDPKDIKIIRSSFDNIIDNFTFH